MIKDPCRVDVLSLGKEIFVLNDPYLLVLSLSMVLVFPLNENWICAWTPMSHNKEARNVTLW